MKQIGIMTYHAAHNFGSVLQAYATQKLLNELGYSNEIINYRLPNQKEYYNKLYSTRFGYKEFLRRLIRFHETDSRKLRIDKFEDFIHRKLVLTETEYNNYLELRNANFSYPVLLAGSDQIWNEHCRAEYWTEPRESILGYYLAIGNAAAARICFSSSFGGMKKDEIEKYLNYLEKFQSISIRESEGAELLSSMLGRTVYNTLDPTLMLNSEGWKLDGTYSVDEDYIFVYTLNRFKAANEFVKNAKDLAKKLGKKVVCVSPLSNILDKDIETHADFGPLDFLSYIRCASLVITDSFHGTAFSVNFRVPFYNIGKGQDSRKVQLLKKLGLESRICGNFEELIYLNDCACEFDEATKRLNEERYKTRQYLATTLREVLPLD